MEQRKVDLNATNELHDSAVRDFKWASTQPAGSRVVVDATHPRFLSEGEKAPVTVSASTEDNFCEQCKMVFAATPEAIRNHFKTFVHVSSSSCTYCGGAVYEFYFGNDKRYAHDCNSKTKK